MSHEPFASEHEENHQLQQFQGPDTAMIYLAISTSECATVALAWFSDSGISGIFCEFAIVYLTFQMMYTVYFFYAVFLVDFRFCHRWSWQGTSANIFNTPPTQTAAAVILGQVVLSILSTSRH